MSNELTEIIRIGGVDIELRLVPPQLCRRYEHARAALDAAVSTPARKAADSALRAVGREIIGAMAPLLAIKAAPRAYGTRQFFEAIAKRRK